jgi:DNA-binding beta-propeller fold protein YncE
VRFDGTRIWVSYIDTSSGTDLLRVATIDTVTQTVTSVDVPGWLPVADTGLELVRIGSTVYVALLEADTLSLLRTCY